MLSVQGFWLKSKQAMLTVKSSTCNCDGEVKCQDGLHQCFLVCWVEDIFRWTNLPLYISFEHPFELCSIVLNKFFFLLFRVISFTCGLNSIIYNNPNLVELKIVKVSEKIIACNISVVFLDIIYRTSFILGWGWAQENNTGPKSMKSPFYLPI